MKRIVTILGSILLISMLSSCVTAWSTNEVPVDEPLFELINKDELQIVLEFNADQSILVEKTKEYIKSTYTDDLSNVNIEENDHIEGVGNYVLNIKGMGVMIFIPIPLDNTQNMFFNYKFDIKDNKIRLTLSEIHFYRTVVSDDGIASTASKQYAGNETEFDMIIKAIAEERILSDLKAFISGQNTDSDW